MKIFNHKGILAQRLFGKVSKVSNYHRNWEIQGKIQLCFFWILTQIGWLLIRNGPLIQFGMVYFFGLTPLLTGSLYFLPSLEAFVSTPHSLEASSSSSRHSLLLPYRPFSSSHRSSLLPPLMVSSAAMECIAPLDQPHWWWYSFLVSGCSSCQQHCLSIVPSWRSWIWRPSTFSSFYWWWSTIKRNQAIRFEIKQLRFEDLSKLDWGIRALDSREVLPSA